MRSTLAALALLHACGSPPPAPTSEAAKTVRDDPPMTEPTAFTPPSPQCPAQIADVRTAAREARAALVAKDPHIAAFWTWWGAHRDELAGPPSDALVEQMTAHVNAIDPALAWEITPAPTGPRGLVVTANGAPRPQQAASRWLASAPKDPTWTFTTMRQPIAPEMLRGGSLRIGETAIVLGELEIVTAEQTRGGLGVTFWHPALAALPRDAALEIVLIALDNAIGEDGTMRWIGGIEIASTAPDGATIDLVGLRDHVAAIAKRHTPGNLQLLRVTRAGAPPLIATRAVGLTRTDRPLHDTFVELSHAYVPDEIEASQDIEASVLARLGDRATHHSSLAGEDRRHTWIYVDGTTDALDTICAWRAEQTRAIEIDAAIDPEWAQAEERLNRLARPR